MADAAKTKPLAWWNRPLPGRWLLAGLLVISLAGNAYQAFWPRSKPIAQIASEADFGEQLDDAFQNRHSFLDYFSNHPPTTEAAKTCCIAALVEGHTFLFRIVHRIAVSHGPKSRMARGILSEIVARYRRAGIMITFPPKPEAKGQTAKGHRAQQR